MHVADLSAHSLGHAVFLDGAERSDHVLFMNIEISAVDRKSLPFKLYTAFHLIAFFRREDFAAVLRIIAFAIAVDIYGVFIIYRVIGLEERSYRGIDGKWFNRDIHRSRTSRQCVVYY